jgi:hypothetical protein
MGKAHHIEVVVGDDLITVEICSEEQPLALIAQYRRNQLDLAKNHGAEIAAALDFPLYKRADSDDARHLLTPSASQ